MAVADTDLGVLSDSIKIVSRCKLISEEFSYSLNLWDSMDTFFEAKPKSKLIIAFIEKGPKGALPAAELAQAVRYQSTDSFLVCVIPNSLGKEEAVFAKKSGANLIITEDEALNTGKLEFIALQTLRSKYLPVKGVDLTAGRPIPLDLYHLLPQRRKFLKAVFQGDVPEESKIKKIFEVGELYFDREFAAVFNQYILDTTDHSAVGLTKRCRSQFLSLFSSFSKLVFQLTDQSQQASLSEGQQLLTECTKLCSDLLGTLAESGKAWEVINNSAIGELGSVERAPAIAAYAGLFGLKMGLNSVDQLMLAALLSDLGLLFLSPTILKKIREDHLGHLMPEERTQYEAYPNKTLEVCLNRKLAIPEKLRRVIVSSNERSDGNGFPNQLQAKRFSIEAQLISFARDFDRKTLLKMGKTRVNPEAALKSMLDEEVRQPIHYNIDFLEKLKAAVF